MPFMLLLTFMGTKYVVKPLKTMRDAAIAMANGDFSIRADDTQRGEIGQLGSSLNFWPGSFPTISLNSPWSATGSDRSSTA